MFYFASAGLSSIAVRMPVDNSGIGMFHQNALIVVLFFRRIALVSLLSLGLAGVSKTATAQETPPVYPRIAGYVGILHPLVTFSGEETVTNFDTYYIVGLPTGINIWKSPKIGFSVEIVPLIRAENGTSKVANLLFHPGVLVSLGHGFTLAGRAAFETAGRYGFTPVLNKIVKKNKNSGYFVAVPLPVRFGNDHPATVTIGFQFGISF